MFKALEHQSLALDRRVRNWRELNVTPIAPDIADPYPRCRIITMNGIEGESVFYDCNFARTWPSSQLRRQLAYLRYIESPQRTVHRWLPGEELPSDRVIDVHRQQFGEDYRLEADSRHPIEELS